MENFIALLWYKSTEPPSLKSAKVFKVLNPLPEPCALKLSETAVNCLNVSLFASLSFIKAKPSFLKRGVGKSSASTRRGTKRY